MFENKSQVFIMCRLGNSSKTVTDILLKKKDKELKHISQILNLQGGLAALAKLDKSLVEY